nr:hypothetical protein [Tanacetum cinerariifolium]
DEEDDEMDVEADEEEEQPAPADSVVVAPTAADQDPSAEETEPFETDESIPFPPLPPILSPPSPVLSPAPPPSPIRSLGYRAAMIRLRDEAASTSSPPLQLPSASHREDRLEVTLPPQKRLDIALGPRYEVGESSSTAAARSAGGFRADYGFVATTERQLLAGWLNMLFRDRRAQAYTRQLMETEARMSKEAWVRATDASDLVHGEVMSLRTTVLGQMSEIRELQAADRKRQTGQVTALQAQVTTLQGQQGLVGTALQGQVTALQKQMAPRRTTRSTADQETVNATTVTNAQLQAMIDQGVTAALAARDALRIKFATCTLHSVALTWWNTHVQTVGHETAYDMSLKTLMKMMTDKYGPRNEIRKLEVELWELKMMTEKYCPQNEIRKLEMEVWEMKVKGNDLASYTQRFQELALLCKRMFFEESDKIEKYVRGLPDMIHGSVVASKPKTMQEAIKIITELMDKKIRTFAERETASKRKFENTSRNTQKQQQQHSNKRQNTG